MKIRILRGEQQKMGEKSQLLHNCFKKFLPRLKILEFHPLPTQPEVFSSTSMMARPPYNRY